jgi:glycosyltransferase involved in cell wall biosynthesis
VRPRIAKIVGDQAWERSLNKRWISPDTDIDAFQNGRYGVLPTLTRALQKWEVRNLDAVIVPSEHRKRLVIGWGVEPGRIHTVYNALDSEFVPVAQSPIEAKSLLGLPTTVPLFLYVGRLIPLKGIHHVINVLKRLGNCNLVIAGDGPLRAELQRIVERLELTGRVHFVGRIKHQDLAIYYRAADYTILYSGGEGLSHVLLESLRAGTPVIASDKGGNPEVVQHEVNGLLVPYINLNALEATLRYAIEPSVQKSLAQNHMVGLDRFDPGRMVEQTLEVLNNHL